MNSRLPNGDERDGGGRFKRGNKAAAGHAAPHAGTVSALRRTMLDAVTDGDIRAIVKRMVKEAKGGDIASAKLILGYVVGRPANVIDQEKHDQHAAAMAEIDAIYPPSFSGSRS